jgi:hypothetical protein
MIPKAECKDRRLYRIRSRNLAFGVYRAESGGFLGLREKFGQVYVFEEYHWENEAFAMVKPIEALPETLPLDIQNEETLGTVCSHCDVPSEYVRWPEGGEREVVLPDGGTMSVPGEWRHLGETTCTKVSAVAKGNRPLHEWLLAMGAKYPSV